MNWMVGLGVLAMCACNDAAAPKNAAVVDRFVAFAQTEIAWLQKSQLGLRKTVTKGEEVSTEDIDSLDWANEMEWVTEWSLTEAAKKIEIRRNGGFLWSAENCAFQCTGYSGGAARIDGELPQRQNSVDAVDHQAAQLVYGSRCADIVSAPTGLWSECERKCRMGIAQFI